VHGQCGLADPAVPATAEITRADARTPGCASSSPVSAASSASRPGEARDSRRQLPGHDRPLTGLEHQFRRRRADGRGAGLPAAGGDEARLRLAFQR
jgi:hypothetical protein